MPAAGAAVTGAGWDALAAGAAGAAGVGLDATVAGAAGTDPGGAADCASAALPAARPLLAGGAGGGATGLAASTTLTAGADAAAAGFSAATAAVSSGLPAFAVSALCLAANGTGGGGGATWATTLRLSTFTGGRAAGPAAGPTTLACTGATGATAVTGARATVSVVTRTISLATGLDCEKVAANTATTAPATCWFA